MKKAVPVLVLAAVVVPGEPAWPSPGFGDAGHHELHLP
jgi:hypothetical protein